MDETKRELSPPSIAAVVADGLLPEAQARKLVDECTKPMPVGEILLRHRMLNFNQVMEILGMQADRPGMRFGELAVEAGFIEPDSVEWALRRQPTTAPHPLERALSRGMIDPPQLARTLVRHVKELESGHARQEPPARAAS